MIADYLKKTCKEKGVPVSRMEKALGFSNGYVASLKGEYIPQYERAVAIANFLKIPLANLVSGYTPPAKGELRTVETAVEIIKEQSGDKAAETVRLLLSLDDVDMAEVRGEVRQMLRLSKYAEMLSKSDGEV